MPANVFATTGTNVSVLFFDNSKQNERVILIDASKLGEEYKDGNNQKRRLRLFEIDQIVSTFQEKKAVEGFSVAVTYEKIKKRNYSLAAGQYFDVKIDHVDISADKFAEDMKEHIQQLGDLFDKSNSAGKELLKQLELIAGYMAGGSHDSI